MALQRATGLVIRATDFSETSRIVTLWTRESGKARALAKGGRRLKSNFEVALDLLTVCDMVLLRKSSGSLDLLTEAQVRERFPQLRQDLPALYSAYYIAEMLGDWTEENDPHPALFDEAVATLRRLGQAEVLTGPCLAHFELAFLRELGYGPALDYCSDCGASNAGMAHTPLAFSAAAGGVVCPACQPRHRDRRSLAATTYQALLDLQAPGEAWQRVTDPKLRAEIRQLLNHCVTHLRGRRPRLLPYLGS
jgi:DNA repair protein RecO (recombination protein O)